MGVGGRAENIRRSTCRRATLQVMLSGPATAAVPVLIPNTDFSGMCGSDTVSKEYSTSRLNPSYIIELAFCICNAPLLRFDLALGHRSPLWSTIHPPQRLMRRVRFLFSNTFPRRYPLCCFWMFSSLPCTVGTTSLTAQMYCGFYSLSPRGTLPTHAMEPSEDRHSGSRRWTVTSQN